jgi:uncharacterized protein YjbI with pentapeptide repeats
MTFTDREDTDEQAATGWLSRLHLRSVGLGTAALLLVSAVIIMLSASVIVFPQWLVASPSSSDLASLTAADRLKALNDVAMTRNAVRTTLVQAIAGALLLLTAFLTWRQVRTAREGQITDRFTKTIEQLGNEKAEVRIGGIYALRQIAENGVYARPIAEIYAAYLKTHSRGGAAAGESGQPDNSFVGAEPVGDRWDQTLTQAPPDLQAILRILILEGLWHREGLGLLDLSFVSVPGADLHEADLSGCILLGADLSGADLHDANLMGVDIRKTNLARAKLDGANLAKADLTGANLSRASCRRADLSNAKMKDARLVDAVMSQSNMTIATLRGAHLIRTELSETDLTSAIFAGATMTGATLIKAKLINSDLTNADLGRADLSGADLTDAILQNVNFHEVRISKETLLETAQIMDSATESQVQRLLRTYK